MKIYIHGLLALLMAMLTASVITACVEDTGLEPADEPASDCFNLVVKVPQKASARAVATPVELNEFKVRSLHLYFYARDGHDDATSLSMFDRVIDVEFDTQGTVNMALPANALLDGGLFGASGTQCIVYAVANVDQSLLPEGTAKTIDGLKATAVGSTFDRTEVQNSFAMDGKATVTMNRSERKATGEIELTRAAAKLTLSVDLPASIVVTGTVINQDGTTSEGESREYRSRADQMHVWIGNGVKQSVLNTVAMPAAETDFYSNEINAADGVGSAFTYDDAMVKYKYVQNVPFYSYPNKWEAATPDGNCHLTLVVPWYYTEGTEQKTVVTYYRLAVQPQMCCIERNMHYDMRVTVGRLGGVEPQKPVEMQTEWNYAIPWNEQALETNIKEIRYLLLNNNYYNPTIGAYIFEMNNETDLSVTLGTSHDVEIASVTMRWIDYHVNPTQGRSITLTGTATDRYNYSSIAGYSAANNYSSIAGYSAANNYAGIEVDNDKDSPKLKFKREMRHVSWSDNRASITSNPAFCAYTFDIVIRHKDDASQKARVRITQTPAIYITAEATTSGTRFVNKNNKTYENRVQSWPTYTTVYKGYITTDNSMPSDDTKKKYYLGSIHNQANWVKNKNTYIITISRFDANETEASYIIADPRTRSVNNLPVNDYDSKIAVAAWSMADNSNKQLQYYYPADSNSIKTQYIAPRFRVASQWGVTYDVTRDGALRRCASYQENGRPAGRWRLPTVAEIKFIANLSCNQYIPFLFGSEGDTADYWCASGAINVINSDSPTVEPTTGNTHSVRCVYDEWYWGNDTLVESDKTEFAWGDRQRTTSGN